MIRVKKSLIDNATAELHGEVLYNAIRALAHMKIVHKYGYNYLRPGCKYKNSFIIVVREVPAR